MANQSIPIKVIDAFLREEMKQRFDKFIEAPQVEHAHYKDIRHVMDAWRWWSSLNIEDRNHWSEKFYDEVPISRWVEMMVRWASTHRTPDTGD